MPNSINPKYLKGIPTGLWARGLAVAKISLSAGVSLANQKVGEYLQSGTPNNALQTMLYEQAKSISTELGQLKGSLMKVGQLLSMYGEYFLPPEANAFFKSLQYQSPPLEWSLVREVLTKELGAEKLALLEIDPNPLAAASLGQVHSAKFESKRIALKIQYPGVESAIDSDLTSLRSILAFGKLFSQLPHFDFLFEEVQRMLHQEIDYRQEKNLHQEYIQFIGTDPRYVVPQVYTDFCTQHIMATSFEEGLPIDSLEVQELSRERRNRLAMNFLELYYRELFEFGNVQTDPHLGNYRIRLNENGEDQLVLLDFGAVRKFDMEFRTNYRTLVRASIANDHVGIEEAAIALKFLKPEDSEELKASFIDFCLLMVEPFQLHDHETYRFRQSDLPRRLATQVGKIIQHFKGRAAPGEVVFLDRKTGGVFIFLAALDADLNARKLFE